MLSLLAEAAEEQPLVCIVDDAQWLDRVSAQTLAFVARRLLAERRRLVFARARAGDEPELAGLPELGSRGCRRRRPRAAGRDDPRAARRARAGPDPRRGRGNPLALLELPRGLTPIAMAGGFGLPDELPLTAGSSRASLRRLEPLPAETRRLRAAGRGRTVGDVMLLWRAAELLGLGPDAAGRAEAAGLIEIGARVRFRHPLVRSAAYRAASGRATREVHRALAEATDARRRPRSSGVAPRRTPRRWPRRGGRRRAGALAGRAQARGGLAAAAAFLERATELTPDPARRAAARAGSPRRRSCGRRVRRGARPAHARRRAGRSTALQRAGRPAARQIAFARARRGARPRRCCSTRRARLEPLDAALARETYLEAIRGRDLRRPLGTAPGAQVARSARAVAADRSRRD